jgi:hypothetical protein
MKKREQLLTVATTILSVSWAIMALPYLMRSEWFYNLRPLIAFPIFQSWLIFLLTGVVALFFTLFQKEYQFYNLFQYAFAFFLGNSFVLDMAFTAPYYMRPDGTINVPVGTSALSNVAPDAFVSDFWYLLLGDLVYTHVWDGVSLWWVLTMPLAISVSFIVIIIILVPKLFINKLSALRNRIFRGRRGFLDEIEKW